MTAIIIEPRFHPALRLVVKNVRSKLPNDWEIIVVHGTLNGAWVREELDFPNIRFVEIPYRNLTIKQYNKICLSPDLYNLSTTENILIFQTDTVILNSNFQITDFLHYDYIGAPIKDTNYFNGGFSLRKKSVFLEILNDPLLKASKENEDIIFSDLLRIRNKALPSKEIAGSFSAETQLLHPNPFAVHKPWNYLAKENLDRLIATSPQLEVLIGAQIQELTDRYYAVCLMAILLIIITIILFFVL